MICMSKGVWLELPSSISSTETVFATLNTTLFYYCYKKVERQKNCSIKGIW